MSVKKIIKERDEMAEGMAVLLQHYITAPKKDLEAIAGLMQMTQGFYKNLDDKLKDKALGKKKTKTTKSKVKKKK
jgi:hypothetical protein